MNKKFFFGTRTRKITTITVGTLLSLFLLYVLVGFLVIAPVAAWQLEEKLPPVLQRNVSIGKIHLNPLTLRVQFDDIAVKKKDGDGNLFSVGMLEAQLSGRSIFVLAPIVRHVRIVKPEVNITRYKDNTLSIDDMLEHFAQQAKESEQVPEEEQEDQRIFPFKVLNLILEDGDIVFNDEKEDAVQTISKLHLAVPLASSFESDLDEAVKPELSMLVNGAPFSLGGSTFPFSNNFLTKFTFTSDDISLARYWRYVPLKSPVALTSGDMRISINLDFSRPEDKPLDLHVNGSVKLKNVGVTKEDKSEVLKIPNMTVYLKKFSLSEKKAIIGTIDIDSPYVEVHRQKDGSVNWATYFKPEVSDAKVAKGSTEKTSAAKTATKVVAEKVKEKISEEDNGDASSVEAQDVKKADASPYPFAVELESFTIKNGKVLFKDSTVPGPFTMPLTPINIAVTNITTEPKKSGDVVISIGDKKMIEVVGNVTTSPIAADLKATISNLGLAQFMPYLAGATPAKIGSGSLSASAAIHIASTPAFDVLVKIANGSARLQNLALTGKDFKKAPISLKTLAVDGANIDLKKQLVDIANIGLLGPEITATRSKDGIDIVSLLVAEKTSKTGADEKSPPSPKAVSSGSSWKLRVQGVSVKNGKITLNDTALQKSVITNLKDVAITASDISLDNKPAAFSVSTGVNEKSSIKAKGTIAHSPLAVNGDVNIKDINIPDFAEYINEYTDVTVTKGTVSANAKGNVSVPPAGDTKISVAGDVTVNNISADNKAAKEHLGTIKQVAVKKAKFDSAKNSASIESVTIDRPETEVILEKDGSISLARAAKKTSAKSKPMSRKALAASQKKTPKRQVRGGRSAIQATTKPFGLSIGTITVKRGAVTFTDASISPKVVLDVEDISASYKRFSLTSKKSSPVNFSATLQGRQISASGTVNPLASPIAMDMTLRLDDIMLDKFSPYTVKYIAYPVKSGSLDANVKVKIQQNKLDAQNKLLFEDFTLGERNAQSKAPSVPIKLGLSLMRQPNGDISLNLPVTGNLKDPNFHINQIIATTLVNMVVKAAISPFTLIGSLVGGVSPEQAQFVTFKPGSAELPKEEVQILTKIASVLKTKPSITLECLGYYDKEIDVKGLQEQALKMAVTKAWYDSLSSGTRKHLKLEDAPVPRYDYEKFLKEAYEDAPDVKDSPRPGGMFGYSDQTREQMEEYLRKTADTTHEALRKLALDRANAVRNVIVKKLPGLEGRVKAVQAGTSKDKAHATTVELKLKN